MVGSKVIFYPIVSEKEQKMFENARGSKIEIPFSFEIGNADKESKYGRKITGGNILAEEFNPFEKEDAEYVTVFIQKNTLKSYSTCVAEYLKKKFSRETCQSNSCCC